MRNIVQCGLNAVRLPFGYWVVQEPGAGEAYEGPCLEALDRAVALIEDVGALQLLLDLHGCPGGESGDRPCGRHDSSWSWERWRTDEVRDETRRTVETGGAEDHGDDFFEKHQIEGLFQSK
eukprot:g3721.t1